MDYQTQVTARKDLYEENQMEMMSRIIRERNSREERKNAIRDLEDKKMFWSKIIAIMLVQKKLTTNLYTQMEKEIFFQLEIKSSKFIIKWYKTARRNRFYRTHTLFAKKILQVKHIISVLVSCFT